MADDYFNYNEKITTGLISEEDIYIGKYIQSIGNSNTIYKIVKTDPHAIASNGDSVYELEILPTHRILDTNYIGSGNILLYNLEDIDYSYVDTQHIMDLNHICETLYTDELNIDVKRERKLNSLGI